jgi:regulator of sigma E protease
VTLSYLLAFLGFAALIILHEAGHFVAAKAVGMRVERFSLFFGPMLIKRRIGETEYGIGPIPLGGYVKISGMSPDEELPPEAVPRAYYNQPVWKRIVVIGAGPLVNLVIAFAVVFALFLSDGQYGGASTTVAAVIDPSPAAKVLKPGDQIISVDGVTGGFEALRRQIATHQCAGGEKVNGCRAATVATLVIRRDGRQLTLKVRPVYNASDHRPLVGFDFAQAHHAVGVGKAFTLTGSSLWAVTKSTVSAVAKVFQSKDRRQLHGVVGIYSVTQKSINQSASEALDILALVSLSLGVINLFPFLPLDGGHIFWALAEKLRGRRIPYVVMERAGFVGFALILMLFVIGLTNDISHPLNLQ